MLNPPAPPPALWSPRGSSSSRSRPLPLPPTSRPPTLSPQPQPYDHRRKEATVPQCAPRRQHREEEGATADNDNNSLPLSPAMTIGRKRIDDTAAESSVSIARATPRSLASKHNLTPMVNGPGFGNDRSKLPPPPPAVPRQRVIDGTGDDGSSLPGTNSTTPSSTAGPVTTRVDATDAGAATTTSTATQPPMVVNDNRSSRQRDNAIDRSGMVRKASNNGGEHDPETHAIGKSCKTGHGVVAGACRENLDLCNIVVDEPHDATPPREDDRRDVIPTGGSSRSCGRQQRHHGGVGTLDLLDVANPDPSVAALRPDPAAVAIAPGYGEGLSSRAVVPTPRAHNRTTSATLSSGGGRDDREELLGRLIREQTEDERERLLHRLLREKEGRELCREGFRERKDDTVDCEAVVEQMFFEGQQAAEATVVLDGNFHDDGQSVVYYDERDGMGGLEEKKDHRDMRGVVAQGNNTTAERSLDADTLAENNSNSIIDQMKIFPKFRGDDDEDASSDVSSLTDAVSYQREKKEARRRQKKEARVKTVDRSQVAIAASSMQEKPGGGTHVASSGGPMAALTRWPRSLRRVVSTRNNRTTTSDDKDPSTAAGCGTSVGHSLDNRTPHTLETIDNSLEQHLYEYGAKKNLFDFTTSRRDNRLQQYGHSERMISSQKNKAPMLFPSLLGESMLGESIDHEKTSVRNLNGHGGGAESQGGHRRWISSLSSFTLPKDEGRIFQTSGGGYHRRMTSEVSDQAGGIRHRRLTSNDSELDGSIQSSWLTSCPLSAVLQLNSPGRAEFARTGTHAIELPRPLEAGEDMIDVLHDEPVDPFSGLIGMPRTAGCRSSVSGDESPGWNVFGTSSFSLGKSPTESTPGSVNDEESDAHIPSSCVLGSRSQIVHRRSKSALHVDEFDPLSLDGILESSQSLTTGSAGSPLRTTAPIPPRHLRDDPMLSKSRYRLPLAPGQQHERRTSKKFQKKKKKKSPTMHRRSSSLDAAGAGNACMFGNVAQLEMNRSPRVITTAPTSMSRIRNTSCDSLEWRDMSTSMSHGRSLGDGGSTGQQESVGLETPGSLQSEGASMARTPSFQVEVAETPKLDDKEDDDDGDDNSSYESFSEEYHRPEQKRTIVAKEMKHIIGRVFPMGKPVIKVGLKLLGREKEEAAIQRSEGCLT